MKTKNYTLYALGLAAAISFVAGTAAAQARSDTRIPVRKDAPPVEAPRVDTVRIMSKPDTVIIRGRTDTVVRTVTLPVVHDTVMQMLPMLRLPGLYFGLASGLNFPMNNFRNSTHDGVELDGMVGWFPENGNIGVRADLLYARLPARKTGCANCEDGYQIALMGDLVMRFPLDRTSKINPALYIMAGGGIDKFNDFMPYRNTDNRLVTAGASTQVGNPVSTALGVTAANRGTKEYFFDYHLGAGMDMRIAGLNWFVEGRWTTINTTGGNTHNVPMLIGLKFW